MDTPHAPAPVVPAVLTIAGSDSGGGAGIQADLKTFEACGVFGTSALTCLTAQNPDEVNGIEACPPDFVALQIRTVCRGFPVAAAKTGMLFAAPIIRAVAAAVRACAIPRLVVDPVMVATSGARLLQEAAVDALCRDLVPCATVLTPNRDEAEILCGRAIRSEEDLQNAARALGERFGVACVVKGGHLAADDGAAPQITDVLYAEGAMHAFRVARVSAAETHGTGCTFAAALAALLARGAPLVEAVPAAQRFVAAALQASVAVGTHRPLHWRAAAPAAGS